MKKLTTTLIAAGVITGIGMSAPVVAAGPSGNVAIVSDYAFRGVSQSNNNITIQGGMDWEKDKMSWGIWGSGLDANGATANGAEIDLYGSYNFGAVNAGFIYYYYPASTGVNLYEVNVGGDAGPVSLKGSYTPDNAGTGISSYYFEGGYSMEISKGVSLDAHIGYGDYYTTATGGAAIDYSLGISGSAAGVDMGLSYAKSDSSLDDKGKVIFTIGKSM